MERLCAALVTTPIRGGIGSVLLKPPSVPERPLWVTPPGRAAWLTRANRRTLVTMTGRREHMGFMTAAQLRGAQPGKKPPANAGDTRADPSEARYADDEKVRAAGDRAVARWAGLLRRLSE